MKQVKDEGIWRPERFLSRPAFDKDLCEAALGGILAKIDRNMATFITDFPAPASRGGNYPPIGNTEWTSSFWTGLLWLAYEVSGDPKYREAAENHLPGFERRVRERICVATHDLGFLYSLSCVAAYKLTGERRARETALLAAELLAARYFERAGIIQAWGDLNDPAQRGRMIIDCNMNLPLLYWASQVSGNPVYGRAAYRHALQSRDHIVREDASTFHTFYMDVETGAPRFGATAQGFADDSCWARGQAWGLYGFVLSYLYTGDGSFIETAKKLIHYFLNRLPEDDVCYWDLIFTAGTEERDSSAAAIAACGLLEISRLLPLLDPLKTIYENAALRIIRSLAENYSAAGLDSNGLLRHAVYSKPAREGVDECVIWGDYFYFEALVRLHKDWKPYW